MNSTDQQRIIEQESSWIDDGFGQLDLSGFPSLNPLPTETTRDDNRFARAYGDTALSRSARELRNFIDNPDADAMMETGSGDLIRDVRDRRAEEIVSQFKRACPGYLPTNTNFNAMVTTLAYNALPESEQNADPDDLVDQLSAGGFWTVENLRRVYEALDAQGLLDVPAGEPRNLSDRERLRVARMAQAGNVEGAIGEFLRCALDGGEPDIEMIHDPRYKGLCDDAVYYVFSETQLDYVETDGRRAYLLRYAGNRPLTLPLLQQAWKSCRENERRHERQTLTEQLEQPQPMSAAQIDELGDDAVDRLYHDSMREYARTVGRGSGIIA